MQHGPRDGPLRGPMGMPFHRDHPPVEDPARQKAIRSIFGALSRCMHCKFVTRSFRHFFLVANVSFETTEEQLRAVLSEVGPVVSLK